MKVLVIGSHGFIGSRLVSNLIEKGHEVFGIDNLEIYSTKHIDFYFKNLDLRKKFFLKKLQYFEKFDCKNYIFLKKIVGTFKPDVVINLGGNSVADKCKENTYDSVMSIYNVNANILEVLKNIKNVKYIFISSSMVYGNFENSEVEEESNKNPIEPYGSLKLGAEYLLKSFSYQFGLSYLIVRPSAVYGPTDANMRVSGIFLYNSFLEKTLEVKNINEKLDFTYVQDLVDGLILAIENKDVINETFNMTYGKSRTIKDFAETLKNINPKINILLNSNNDQLMPGLKRPVRGTLDISKAKKMLGYDPQYPLERGIREYYDFFRINLKNYFSDKS